MTLPHDFSIEPSITIRDSRASLEEWGNIQVGPFTRLNFGNSDQGQLPGGEGWYRKTFRLPLAAGQSLDDYLGKNEVSIQFDGVYSTAEVWINGQKAVMNQHGYMPFVARLNDVLRNPCYRLKDEKKVVIAVRSLNVDHNSRWYSGSGIFRRVWLITTGKQHLNQWDIFVDGSEVSVKKGANVKIAAKVFNDDQKAASGEVVFDILDATGKVVASTTKHYQATTMGKRDQNGVEVNTGMLVKSPHLWSDIDPYRYTARISVISGGVQCDKMEIPFGIRTIAFSAKEGFKLNGRQVKLKGGCVHHDNGLLGAAGIDRADIRKVQLMKAQGYNAVRCSHNLPTEAFLYACDSIGMLVIDEVFDQWEEAKRSNDYSQYFARDHQKDMALMVRRDRNHPSVIMWSIGNEIAQRADVPRGKEIALSLNLAANQQDHARPTTMAVNEFWDRPRFKWETDSPRAFENIEVGGYNYAWKFYEADHDSFPDRIMYGSESFPKEMAQNWNLVDKHPYVIGDFVWTAIDYLGEAGLGHTFERSDNKWIQLLSWPWFNAWCGDLDLVGDKKPQSYYRDVLWGRSKLAMAVRPAIPDGEHEDVNGWGWTAEENHWNWADCTLWKNHNAKKSPSAWAGPIELRPENYQTANVIGNISHNPAAHRDDSLRVNVYSREPRVRLLINDSIMGEQDINPETYTATFTVAYQPGSLKAMIVPQARKAKPDSLEFVTALPPARIVLRADRATIAASHNDLSYITISIEDEEGHLCPTAEIPLEISFTGSANVVAGTGHPYDMKSFRSLRPTTFRGRALAIVQPQDKSGTVTLTVRAKGLPDAQLTIEMK